MDMALPVSLDLDLLRSFVAIAEEKSFTRAADRVGRTQSAVSLQMQRLETLIEQTLLDRGKGGSVELAPAGQYLLTRAREILAMNDDIVKSLRRTEVHGRVRLGIASEFAPHLVSSILQAFALRAPDVEVEMVQTVSCALAVKLKAGELDVVILEQGWNRASGRPKPSAASGCAGLPPMCTVSTRRTCCPSPCRPTSANGARPGLPNACGAA